MCPSSSTGRCSGAKGSMVRAPRRASARPHTTWYLAEGATHGFFDLFYLLQNPSATDSGAGRGALPAAGSATPVVRTYTVPPATRLNILVDTIPGLEATDVSAPAEHQQRADHRRAGDVFHARRPAVRRRSCERGRDRAGNDVAAGRGGDRKFLRSVRAHRQPVRNARRGAHDVPAAERATDCHGPARLLPTAG